LGHQPNVIRVSCTQTLQENILTQNGAWQVVPRGQKMKKPRAQPAPEHRKTWKRGKKEIPGGVGKEEKNPRKESFFLKAGEGGTKTQRGEGIRNSYAKLNKGGNVATHTGPRPRRQAPTDPKGKKQRETRGEKTTKQKDTRHTGWFLSTSHNHGLGTGGQPKRGLGKGETTKRSKGPSQNGGQVSIPSTNIQQQGSKVEKWINCTPERPILNPRTLICNRCVNPGQKQKQKSQSPNPGEKFLNGRSQIIGGHRKKRHTKRGKRNGFGPVPLGTPGPACGKRAL